MIQAIIFDMDGVIVDTEYLEFSLQKQFIEKIKEHGETITLAQQSEVVGKPLKEIPAIVKKLAGSTLPLEEIHQRYDQFFHTLFSNVNYLEIFRSDIKSIIQFAKQNQIKLAVASSSTLSHIHTILSACHIKDEFDLIVSGELFEYSKPDPTIYRYTCKQLGVNPENTVAIEDSLYGIQSAKTAGLTVIGYEEKRMIIDQSLADYIGRDMNEILAIIKNLM